MKWINHPGFGSVCWPIFTFVMFSHQRYEWALIGAFLAGVSVYRLAELMGDDS